jgi:hypothetical protein
MVASSVLILSLVAMVWIIGTQLGTDGGKDMPRGYVVAMVALVCMHTVGFGVLWAHLAPALAEDLAVTASSDAQSATDAARLPAEFRLPSLPLILSPRAASGDALTANFSPAPPAHGGSACFLLVREWEGEGARVRALTARAGRGVGGRGTEESLEQIKSLSEYH